MTQMEAAIAAAVAAVMAKQGIGSKTAKRKTKAKGKKKASGKLTDAERAVHMAANDAQVVKLFGEAGFKDVQPRVNVLTYNRFIAEGRKVRAGEKSIKVGPFALFHISQTDAIAAPAEQVAA